MTRTNLAIMTAVAAYLLILPAFQGGALAPVWIAIGVGVAVYWARGSTR